MLPLRGHIVSLSMCTRHLRDHIVSLSMCTRHIRGHIPSLSMCTRHLRGHIVSLSMCTRHLQGHIASLSMCTRHIRGHIVNLSMCTRHLRGHILQTAPALLSRKTNFRFYTSSPGALSASYTQLQHRPMPIQAPNHPFNETNTLTYPTHAVATRNIPFVCSAACTF